MTRHREDCPFCRMNALGFTADQLEFLTEMMAVTSGTTWAVARRRPPRHPDKTFAKILNRAHTMWAFMFGTPIPESDEVAEHRHHHGDQP